MMTTPGDKAVIPLLDTPARQAASSAVRSDCGYFFRRRARIKTHSRDFFQPAAAQQCGA
jgi:hypothetical protein